MKSFKNCLKNSVESLIWSKNAKDIRDGLQKLRVCFERMGIPKFHNTDWCNTVFGYIYLDGSTKYVYEPPSVEEIKKYWLSKSFSGFNDISIVFADIFRVINSLLPHLKGLKIRVPEVRVYARVYKGNEDAVKKVKELMNSNSPDIYEKFLKLWEECEDIKIDGVYVKTVIAGKERSFWGLKKELLKPVNRVELRAEFCDEDEFAFEPWI